MDSILLLFICCHKTTSKIFLYNLIDFSSNYLIPSKFESTIKFIRGIYYFPITNSQKWDLILLLVIYMWNFCVLFGKNFELKEIWYLVELVNFMMTFHIFPKQTNSILHNLIFLYGLNIHRLNFGEVDYLFFYCAPNRKKQLKQDVKIIVKIDN